MGNLTLQNMLLLTVAFITSTIVTNEARSDTASTTLEILTLSSDAIVIAKVDNVTKIDNVKVAEATVIRSLKGLRAQERFAFLAEKTWTCDISDAEKGETVLIFLDKFSDKSFLQSHPQFESELVKLLPGVPFYQIEWSGHGRMPVRHKDQFGKEYLAAQQQYQYKGNRTYDVTLWVNLVIMPSNLRIFPYPYPTSAARKCLVQLKEVEDTVTMFSKKVSASSKEKPSAAR